MRCLALLPVLIAACSPPSPEQAERGRMTYMANCLACHHADPAKPGVTGPAVQGASRELLEARVVRAVYPPGYTPKRTTKLMVPLPQLADKIEDLAAYLR